MTGLNLFLPRLKTNKMRVELIFVDSKQETKSGFYRGFVALFIFILMLIVWHLLFKSVYPTYVQSWTMWVGVLIISVLFSSALAVAHPKNIQTAITYGGLVGLVIFGSINASLLIARYPWYLALLDTLFGILAGILIAALLFKFF